MENQQFQTSFIPKKPIIQDPVVHKSYKAPFSVSIFYVIGVLFLLIAGGAYFGLSFFKSTLEKKIADSENSMSLAKKGFELATISDLQLFDKRISTSKEVLAAHTAVSPFFELLNSLTVPSIQFTRFEGGFGTDGKTFSVKMNGVSKDYKSIAIQAQVFNSAKGKYFKNVLFSGLTLSNDKDKKGYVTFNITLDVDPILISYEKQISGQVEKVAPTSIMAPVTQTNIQIQNAEILPTTLPDTGIEAMGNLDQQIDLLDEISSPTDMDTTTPAQGNLLNKNNAVPAKGNTKK